MAYLLIVGLWLRQPIPELTIGALSSSYVNSVNLRLPIAIFVLDDASFIAHATVPDPHLLAVALTALDLTALGGQSR